MALLYLFMYFIFIIFQRSIINDVCNDSFIMKEYLFVLVVYWCQAFSGLNSE